MAVYAQQRGIACRRAADLTRDNANQRYAVRLDPRVSTGLDDLPTVTLTRAEADVLVVDGGDLTGTITVDNDLSSIATVRDLQVQLSGATVITSGTVDITGTDAAGAAQTETLTFALGSLNTAQTTSNAYATVTAVTASDFNSGTVDITALRTEVDEVFGEYQTFDKSAVHIRNQGTMVLRAAATYTSAHNGYGVIASDTAGVVEPASTLGTGFGRIIGGGTENINGVDTNVYEVIVPEC